MKPTKVYPFKNLKKETPKSTHFLKIFQNIIRKKWIVLGLSMMKIKGFSEQLGPRPKFFFADYGYPMVTPNSQVLSKSVTPFLIGVLGEKKLPFFCSFAWLWLRCNHFSTTKKIILFIFIPTEFTFLSVIEQLAIFYFLIIIIDQL